jgi:hypothetical protein
MLAAVTFSPFAFSDPVVTENGIIFPDDGNRWKVYSAEISANVCLSWTDGLSCFLSPGTYRVTNVTTGSAYNFTIEDAEGMSARINTLGELSQNCTAGQFVQFDGSNWQCANGGAGVVPDAGLPNEMESTPENDPFVPVVDDPIAAAYAPTEGSQSLLTSVGIDVTRIGIACPIGESVKGVMCGARVDGLLVPHRTTWSELTGTPRVGLCITDEPARISVSVTCGP